MMSPEEALACLAKMEQDSNTKMMINVIKKSERVPLWIENEIRFEKVSSPRLEGNVSGTAAYNEDRKYHGGYVE